VGSWFLIDVVSVFPFGMVVEATSGGGGAQLKMLRIVRCLRLLKLLRILRASRMFARWEAKITIRHSVLSILKNFGLIVFVSHWGACFWALCPLMLEDGATKTWVNNWMSSAASMDALATRDLDKCRTPDANAAFWTECYDASALYVAALHWCVMTLTTVGDFAGGRHVQYTRPSPLFILLLLLLLLLRWGTATSRPSTRASTSCV
jgi:hypothetical protein